jgi:3-deoxy-manno-octulosonate cytidylyltransferase (CMP-KDO synthetase)
MSTALQTAKYTIIIPARLNSTRLPQKPLADIHGAPMVIRTAQQAAKTKARVVIATDAEEILTVAKQYGFEACLTDENLNSGTERVAQAAMRLGLADDEIVINLQGDEPLMPHLIIEEIATHLANSVDGFATAAHGLQDVQDIISPNSVKVILNQVNQAIYFSRAPIPWQRDEWMHTPIQDITQKPDPSMQNMLKHIGVYGFRVKTLKQFAELKPTALETIEMLEQLRALYYGLPIYVLKTNFVPPTAVDTPADLEKVRALFTWAVN